jgi:hypothetical protein
MAKDANEPKDFPVFTKLNLRQLSVLCAKFKYYLGDFEKNCCIHGIYPDSSVMIDICDRIEKRRVYFHIYHNSCKMGELNEGALMCFWIIKLMPFSHKNIPANELNAKIALYLLNRMIIYYARKNNKKVNISFSLYKNIYYSFRFRDISKEAIMVLAESMIY